MKSLIFLAISLFVYIGAFDVGGLIFGIGGVGFFFGVVAGGSCFWWVVSKADKLDWTEFIEIRLNKFFIACFDADMKPLKNLLCISLMVGGAFLGPHAVAADNKGKYVMLGASTCGAYLKELSAGSIDNVRDYGWLAGYITAYNVMTPNTYDILGNSDLRSVELWVKNYCDKNPLKNISNAVEVLMIELYPTRKIKGPN
jgi:hypothetical protein